MLLVDVGNHSVQIISNKKRFELTKSPGQQNPQSPTHPVPQTLQTVFCVWRWPARGRKTENESVETCVSFPFSSLCQQHRALWANADRILQKSKNDFPCSLPFKSTLGWFCSREGLFECSERTIKAKRRIFHELKLWGSWECLCASLLQYFRYE